LPPIDPITHFYHQIDAYIPAVQPIGRVSLKYMIGNFRNRTVTNVRRNRGVDSIPLSIDVISISSIIALSRVEERYPTLLTIHSLQSSPSLPLSLAIVFKDFPFLLPFTLPLSQIDSLRSAVRFPSGTWGQTPSKIGALET